MAREYTRDECRELFIRHIWMMIGYWNTVEPFKDEPPISQRDRLSGLAHSLLTMLDGNSMGMPAFLVVPAPHPGDEDYHRKRGENWWPRSCAPMPWNELGGALHEILYKYGPQRATDNE